MSYCTLEEAFQSNISETAVLPPYRAQLEDPSSKGEKGRMKPRRQKRSNLPPQEPSIIEPDRAGNRPKPPAELLGGGNNTTTSISSYLMGAGDPNEDYFPYPTGSGNEPGFDKSFMLEPNWYEQFQERVPSPRTETPPFPGDSVDGYDTLYQQIPQQARSDYIRSRVLAAQQNPQQQTFLQNAQNQAYQQINNAVGPTAATNINGNGISRQLPTERESSPHGSPTTVMGSAPQDAELRRRIDDIFTKIERLEISRSESNHSEIILFIMTGIFVLLLLDLLLKQGTRAIGTIATAAAIPFQHHIRGSGGGDRAFSHPLFF
jgi:hypothetical protein